jgi:hypothetical protein
MFAGGLTGAGKSLLGSGREAVRVYSERNTHPQALAREAELPGVQQDLVLVFEADSQLICPTDEEAGLCKDG